jgi:hypothetical protein
MRRTPAAEAELAAFYDQHVDDPDRWSEPVEPPPGAGRRRPGASITVRFSAYEVEHIRRTSRVLRKTYSEVIRAAVHAYTEPQMFVTVSYASEERSRSLIEHVVSQAHKLTIPAHGPRSRYA